MTTDDTEFIDQRLDVLLEQLHADRDISDAALASVRIRVLVAAADTPAAVARSALTVPTSLAGRPVSIHSPPRPTRRRRSLLAAAAAVVLLVGGGLIIPSLLPSSRGGASAQAAEVLNQAANAISATDDLVLAPGQYRYIETHAWWLNATTTKSGATIAWRAENLIQVWEPADPSGKWLLKRSQTGQRQWVTGSEVDAKAAGLLNTPAPEQIVAACGGFYLGAGETTCQRQGSWQDPTPQFVAALPRDPDQLLSRLGADGQGNTELLVHSADLLRSGLVPADLRAALYDALTKVPGLQVTEQVANLDGRVGVALGMPTATGRQDIIVDPDTGTFIGEREIFEGGDGLPVGTVTTSSSVTTAVVSAMGEVPVSK